MPYPSQPGNSHKRPRTQLKDKEGGEVAHPHICAECRASFNSARALGMHARISHGQRSFQTNYADSDGICPICSKIFPTRLRLIAHLTERRPRGGRVPCGLQLDQARRLSNERVAMLDALDTKERSKARKAGKTQPSVGGRSKRLAIAIATGASEVEAVKPSRKRLRSKTTCV